MLRLPAACVPSRDGVSSRPTTASKQDAGLASNDGDLIRALTDVPAARLALIDEAFVLLDGGLGAVFAEKKAAGGSRSESPNLSVGASGAASDSPPCSNESTPRRRLRGAALLKDSALRLTRRRRLHSAQRLNLQMMEELMASSGDERGPAPQDEQRPPSAVLSPPSSAGGDGTRGKSKARSTGYDAPVAFGSLHAVQERPLPPGHLLHEDKELRKWAEEQLSLPCARLDGLENKAPFRRKLAHQMLCWQALHPGKLTLPSDGAARQRRAGKNGAHQEYTPLLPKVESTKSLAKTDSTVTLPLDIMSSTSSLWSLPRGDASEAEVVPVRRGVDVAPPSRLVAAASSLFGLTHHLDAQRNRRSMPRKLGCGYAELHLPPIAEAASKGIGIDRGAERAFDSLRPDSSSSKNASIDIAIQAASVKDRYEKELEDQQRAMLANKWSHRLPSFGQARDGAPGISLRRPGAFVEPHCNIMSADIGNTPEFVYLRRCEHAGLVPCPAVWRCFGTDLACVAANKRSLTDADIGAIVETVVQCASRGHHFKRLDLDDNALTDHGLSYVARCLVGPDIVCTSLVSLSLAGNTMLKLRSDAVLNDLANALRSLPHLQVFDLSRVPLQGEPMLCIAAALGGCKTLKSLSLADCGLGRMDQRECVAVAKLLECGPSSSGRNSQARSPRGGRTAVAVDDCDVRGLEQVDLSANFFGRVGFAAVAAALRNSRIQRLSFAGNGGMHGGEEEQCRFHPIQLLLESLQFNDSLQVLDVSNSGIGPDSAFVLEDALQLHSSIKHVELADNPLGDAGLRAMLRLVAVTVQNLQTCSIIGHREPDASAHLVKFRHSQHSGSYTINLGYPHERAILRALLKYNENHGRNSSVGSHYFKNFRFDPKTCKPVVSKDPSLDRWVVPTSGIFAFSYMPHLSEAVFKHTESLPKAGRLSETPTPSNALTSQAGRALRHLKEIGFGVTGGDAGSARSVHFDGAIPSAESSIRSDKKSSKGAFVVGKFRVSSAVTATGSDASNTLGLRESTVACLPDTRCGRGTVKRPWKPPSTSFEADYREVQALIKVSRMRVASARFPVIRRMFLCCATQEQQLRFTLACSRDLSFNSAQVMRFCEDKPELAHQLICSLFPGIRGKSTQLTVLSSKSTLNVSTMMLNLKDYVWFQEGNVTGAYHLDLSQPAQYAVAENCLLVNAWESEVGKAQGLPDLSQRGNFEMLRNEIHNEVPFQFTREWVLPSRGFLRFDYSSFKRPPPGTQAMTEANEIPKFLRSSSVGPAAKLRALRAVSVHCYLSTAQFRQVMACFEKGFERQDVFCILHTRVVDPARLLGAELLNSTGHFGPEDRQHLLKRVGHLHLLNPLYPDGVTYVCNLMVYEERTVLDFLVQLTVKEPGGKVVGHSINNDKYAKLSASWADKGVPEEDVVFKCKYEEAQNCNPPWRLSLSEQYCGNHFKNPYVSSSETQQKNPSKAPNQSDAKSSILPAIASMGSKVLNSLPGARGAS